MTKPKDKKPSNATKIAVEDLITWARVELDLRNLPKQRRKMLKRKLIAQAEALFKALER
jgi:hypothetical protein